MAICIISTILLGIIPLQEIVILCLLLLLVIYSISMFINNWSRNYRDITQPAYIVSEEEAEEGEDPEAAHLTSGLPWDHDEDLSLAESRMSKLSQVVQVSQAHDQYSADCPRWRVSRHFAARRCYSGSRQFSDVRKWKIMIISDHVILIKVFVKNVSRTISTITQESISEASAAFDQI